MTRSRVRGRDVLYRLDADCYQSVWAEYACYTVLAVNGLRVGYQRVDCTRGIRVTYDWCADARRSRVARRVKTS